MLTSGIENNNSFPHPLSPEKESEYLDKFRSGDIEARDILIKHNLRLVVYIAKKYTNYPDKDELISVGTVGLIKAINTYKPNKNTALATYASRCIENEILMAMRGYKKRRNNVSLYENVGADKDGNDITLIDMLAVDEEMVYGELETGFVKESLLTLISKYLEPREKELIRMRYGLDGNAPLTQQETAKRLGISRSYVSRLEKNALKKLKAGIVKEKIEF